MKVVLKFMFGARRAIASLALLVACAGCTHANDLPEDGAAGIAIKYILPEAARVSLAVYDSKERQVRTLLRGESQTAGAHSVVWDGLDAQGKALPLGFYTWKLLRTQGLTAEYITTLGSSFGPEMWVGNHHGPTSIAVSNGVIHAAAFAEAAPHYAGVSFDGKLLYSQPQLDPTYSNNALAATGDTRYDLTNGGLIYAMSPAGIRKLHGEKLFKSIEGTPSTTEKSKTFTIDVPNGAYFIGFETGGEKASAALNYSVGGKGGQLPATAAGATQNILAPMGFDFTSPFAVTDGKLTVGVSPVDQSGAAEWTIRKINVYLMPTRMDAAGNELVLTYPQADKIAWLDPTDGHILQEASVHYPQDIKIYGGAGHVLVLSGDKVLSLSREEPQPKTRISGLTSPQRLAARDNNGAQRIFVYEGGESSQIKSFDANFKPVKTFGRHGGRRDGLYVPEDFNGVMDLACDERGGFVIAEPFSAPRRVARFDASGKLLKEWYGGQSFFTNSAVDPRNPDRIWFDSGGLSGFPDTLVEAEVDYAHKSWKVRSTYDYQHPNGGLFPRQGGGDVGYHVLYHGNDKYLVHQGGGAAVLWVDEANRHLVPVMLMPFNARHYAEQQSDEVRKWLAAHPEARSFQWTNPAPNGVPTDDIIKTADFQPVASEHWGAGWFLGPGWGYHTMAGFTDQFLAVKEWRGKVPVFGSLDKDLAQMPLDIGATDLPGGWPETPTRSSPESVSMLLDAPGNRYVLTRNGGDMFRMAAWGTMAHYWQWPGNIIDGASLGKWDKSGKLLWQVGHLSSTTGPFAGNFHFPVRLGGLVKNCVAVADRIVTPAVFYTDDGLYAGQLFDKRANDGLPSKVYSWFRADTSKGDDYATNLSQVNYDMAAGASVFERQNGEVIAALTGWNSIPLYRITGWNDFKRQQGTITLTAHNTVAPATAQGTGLTAEYYANPNLKGDYALTRLDPILQFGPSGNNNNFPWSDVPATKAPFSVHWHGKIEPKFSERYVLSIYRRGTMADVRVLINGEEVLKTTDATSQWVASKAVEFQAGVPVPIEVQARGLAPDSQLHLVWESPSQAVQHIPTTALYPTPTIVRD